MLTEGWMHKIVASGASYVSSYHRNCFTNLRRLKRSTLVTVFYKSFSVFVSPSTFPAGAWDESSISKHSFFRRVADFTRLYAKFTAEETISENSPRTVQDCDVFSSALSRRHLSIHNSFGLRYRSNFSFFVANKILLQVKSTFLKSPETHTHVNKTCRVIPYPFALMHTACTLTFSVRLRLLRSSKRIWSALALGHESCPKFCIPNITTHYEITRRHSVHNYLFHMCKFRARPVSLRVFVLVAFSEGWSL